MSHLRVPRHLAALLFALAAASCGPPPMALDDLPPCAMLRRQVCGIADECRNPPSPNDCDACKARLCQRVIEFEEDNQQGLCLLEWRSRPEYPVCRAPEPLPTIPPPPFIVTVQCERECSAIPYPPAPPRPNF